MFFGVHLDDVHRLEDGLELRDFLALPVRAHLVEVRTGENDDFSAEQLVTRRLAGRRLLGEEVAITGDGPGDSRPPRVDPTVAGLFGERG